MLLGSNNIDMTFPHAKYQKSQNSFKADQQDENSPTCHTTLQLVRLASADDEGAALSLEEKTEELDLAVHVAVQGGNHAVGDILGRTVSVVLLAEHKLIT